MDKAPSFFRLSTLAIIFIASICTIKATLPDLNVQVKTSSTATQYYFSEIRKITFATEGVNVVTKQGDLTQYAYNKFSSIWIGDYDPTFINAQAIETYNGQLACEFKDGTIIVSGEKISSVIVRNLHGFIIASGKAHDNICELDLARVPNGIYIISAETCGRIISKKIVK